MRTHTFILALVVSLPLGCLGTPPEVLDEQPDSPAADAGSLADAGVADPDPDSGTAVADGGSGARVRLSVKAVEHCAVEAPVFPGLASATPTASRAGVVAVELLRDRDDPAPVRLELAAPLAKLDLGAGALVADAVVPAGTYRYLRYSLAYGAVTVPAVVHSGTMALAGFLEYDVATAAHTLDGRSRAPGDLTARFTSGSFSTSFSANVALDCPLSASGGVVETGGGSHRVLVPVPGGSFTVEDGAARDLEAHFPLAGAVTWRDLSSPGFSAGSLDLTGMPSSSELPARLPICDLFLSDRCEPDAAPPRVLPAWPVPDSATTTCTDGSKVAACPAPGTSGYGQDGNTSVNPAHYTVSGETVRDEVTGLVWQRSAAPESLDWWKAREYCAGLALGGRSDWSLPSRVELASLLDVGRFGPSIDLAAFPGSPADFFWTASAASFSSLAFGIRFDQGFVYDHDPKVSGRVRCVAAPAPGPASHLTVVGDTARDTRTGLVWQRGHFPAASWLDALAACEDLTLGGSADWRLPNVKELLTIVEDTAINPSVDVGAFPDTPAEWFWASTPSLAPTDYAWTVSFTDGFDTPAAVTQRYLFRCVRQ